MASLDDYRVLREAAGLIDRSLSRGRLRLVGPDRRAYLQGLLTNDIAALHSGTGCYTAYLTPQGRMLADMRVFELGDALLVDLENDVAESVRARWEQFIFSEDVSVESVSASTAQIGVYGPRAAFVLESGFAGAQTADEPSPRAEMLRAMTMHANSRWEFRGAAAFMLRSDDIGVDGFDVVVPVELKLELLERLREAGAASVGSDAVEVCRIEAGLPRFHIDMDEDTIPLEAGIEDRAISLTKGCYVGQEIIIRVLHRGHGRVARKLVGFLLESSAAVPARGQKVTSGEREIGAITSAARSRALQRPIALGYVHRDFVHPGTSVSVNGSPATISGLPFLG